MLSALFKMARKQQRPAQCDLDFEPRKWGGKREGAGRKRKRHEHDSAHRTHPEVRAYHPRHVVMRIRKGLPKLRNGRGHRAVRRALVKCLGLDSFRVCHVSIQRNHLHFIVEAKDKRSLSRGMQRLNIRVARELNQALGRKGSVFAFRYHATPITSPKQARNCLAYVLNNWRRHAEDESCERARFAKLDPYASGVSFDGWKGHRFAAPAWFEPLPVSEPSTWLLRVGWRKHGLIGVDEVPGPLS